MLVSGLGGQTQAPSPACGGSVSADPVVMPMLSTQLPGVRRTDCPLRWQTWLAASVQQPVEGPLQLLVSNFCLSHRILPFACSMSEVCAVA